MFDLRDVSRKQLILLFLAKAVTSLLVWAIYTYYYDNRITADIFKYYDASKIMFDALSDNPVHFAKMFVGIDANNNELYPYFLKMNVWFNSADNNSYNSYHFIIRLNSLIQFFSFGYYHVHALFFCFISFTGLTLIYKTFINHIDSKGPIFLLILTLFPSLLFWTSGVFKEAIIVFALSLLTLAYNKSFTIKHLILFVLGCYLLSVTRVAVLACTIPSLLLLVWLKFSNGKLPFIKSIASIIICVSIAISLPLVTPNINPIEMPVNKQKEFIELSSGEHIDANYKHIPIAGSTISINQLEPTVQSLITNSPKAFFNTLFRPFVWEAKSLLMQLASIENVLLILFAFLCLRFRKKSNVFNWGLIYACLLFVFFQFIVIGLTTPVIGAIVRYKAASLLAILIIGMHILDHNRVNKWLRKT